MRRVKSSKIDIYFYDTHTIYVLDGKIKHTFHRWFSELGFYAKNWAKFRQALKRRKDLTTRDIYVLAGEFDIEHTCNTRPIELRGKKVEYEND